MKTYSLSSHVTLALCGPWPLVVKCTLGVSGELSSGNETVILTDPFGWLFVRDMIVPFSWVLQDTCLAIDFHRKAMHIVQQVFEKVNGKAC